MLVTFHKIINTGRKLSSLVKLYLSPLNVCTIKKLNEKEKAFYDLQSLLSGTKIGNLTPYMYWGENDYFDQLITKNKNYYLYSDEISLINSNINKIKNHLKNCDAIVDLGPGSESSFIKKTLPLIKSLPNLSRYYSVDISKEYSTNAAKLAKRHAPHLSTHSIVGDIENLELPQTFYSSKKRLFLFTGSTLGNFSDEQMDSFLSQVSNHMKNDDHIFVTCDTNHDKESLLKAYDNVYAKKLVLNSLIHIDALLNSKINFRNIKGVCEWDKKTKTLQNYFMSSKLQILKINNTTLKIEGNKKYNIVNSRKFDTLTLKQKFAKHHFDAVTNFISPQKRMAIYVFKLNKKGME